jgi:hypothetical protein
VISLLPSSPSSGVQVGHALDQPSNRGVQTVFHATADSGSVLYLSYGQFQNWSSSDLTVLSVGLRASKGIHVNGSFLLSLCSPYFDQHLMADYPPQTHRSIVDPKYIEPVGPLSVPTISSLRHLPTIKSGHGCNFIPAYQWDIKVTAPDGTYRFSSFVVTYQQNDVIYRQDLPQIGYVIKFAPRRH